MLASCAQPHHRIVPEQDKDYRTRAPVLNLDERGNLVGFRFHPRSLAPIDACGQTRDLHLANAALGALALDEKNHLRYPLPAGEGLFFDNHRVMHARTAFSDRQRHLQICNLSREQFQQKLRLTAGRLGFSAEAQQTLPAGVSG